MVNRICVALRSYGFGNQRVIPSLDGLRAISIALVLVGHMQGTLHAPGIPLVGWIGAFGVRIFLVISGYLITSILLDELRRRGTISLPRFYFRRTLRLFPAAYFLIAVTAALSAAHLAKLLRWDLIFALTYTTNYYDGRGWPLGHLWSLAVEEQFYLVWPLTLRTLGPARARSVLLGVLAVAPLLRLASPYVGPAFNFLVYSDALGTGCLLTIMRDELAANRRYSKLLASRWFFLVPLAAVAANYIPSTKVTWLVGITIMNVAIALCTDWSMRNASSLVGRFLNLPTVGFIGVLSYSLYLWQQLFLDRYSTRAWCTFPLNIVLAFALALFSYLLIEAPFLRLRAVIERARKAPRNAAAPAPLAG